MKIYQRSEGFPDSERFSLTSQLRRAALAIPSNIAEGAGRESDKEFSRFLAIAYGSLMECLTQTEIAKRLCYLTDQQAIELREQAREISKMLSGLRNRLKRKVNV